ncbi:MAG: hypothetical protein HKN12_07410, partial [Gemmatimonadetes bacterium]|nr:hypothetical protein [Gemmatimonadota bacterium]
MAERGFLDALIARAGLFLRAGLLAVILAGAAAYALPARWESAIVLLPPDRRGDDFRYGEGGVGSPSLLRRLLRTFRPRDDAHPLDVWEAVVTSPETARRLVLDFGLQERWGLASLEKATERLQDAIAFEDVPYRGVEIRCATEDAELSADLANAAADILRDRLSGMYNADVTWERQFLQEAAELREESALRTEERLLAAQLASGVFAEEDQSDAQAGTLQDLARQVVDARIAHARQVVDAGRGSPAEREARRRVEELERAAARFPWMASSEEGRRALEAEQAKLADAAELLTLLRMATIEHQAAHDNGIRILDPAVPADEPDRPLLLGALLALIFVPAPFAGSWWAGRLGRTLPADVQEPFRPLVGLGRRVRRSVSRNVEVVGLAVASALAGL